MRLRRALAVSLALAPLLACASRSKTAADAKTPCATLDAAKCDRARALLGAFADYGVSAGPFVVDAAKPRATGRGVVRDRRGAWHDAGLACGAPSSVSSASNSPSAHDAPSADGSHVDHAFVAFLLDDAIVPPDLPLATLVDPHDAKPHVVRLAAIALARDLAPTFLEPTSSVTRASPCACGDATHAVADAKRGAMIAYDVDARRLDDRAPLEAAFRAALVDSHAAVAESHVGELALHGLGHGRTIAFAITTLAPVAHSVVAMSDLCPDALAAPEVVPAPVDFGDAPYGHPVSRTAHIVNRARVGVRALRGTETITIPARSSIDLPLAWTPQGDAFDCETQTRDETILFQPDGDRATVPTEQAAVIHERIRTGRETVTDVDRIDTTTRHEVDFEAGTSHDVACPPDFAIASCRAEKRACSDGARDCSGAGYGVVASVRGNGCHFACRGPGADPRAFCRFDAVTECRLACTPPPR